MSAPTITPAEYARCRRHGYAGPLTELEPQNRRRYVELGANAWQLAHEDTGTVLRPVSVQGGVAS